MSDSSKAVFLSYASQDAPAVERIAEALRAAGIEVWFDKNELVGGDAWDQKIRRQIKECALFVPVISANTNARAEGYFRLEWKLAVDRSHLMADDAPFLFPVVIDDTSDAAARVPDRFRDVQWTRLNVKDTPETLAKRVAKLLGDEGVDAGAVADRAPGQRPGLHRKPTNWVGLIGMIGGLAIGLVYALRPIWTPSRRAEVTPLSNAGAGTRPPTLGKPVAPLSEARQLVARARAMSLDKYDSTKEDFAAAENLIKRALELDPNDAEIWAVSSQLNFSFGGRGFDHAPARVAAARSQAERALSLDPNSLEGLFALGRWQRDKEEPAVAEATFKKVLAREPNHPGALNNLAWVYEAMNRVDESVALYERAAALPNGNPALQRYTEFLLYFHRGRFEEADRCIRQSAASQPSANSLSMSAILLVTWKGDADGAARVLASGLTAARNEPRTIWTTAMVQLCQRAPDDALKTLGRFSDDYIQDNWFSGPRDYWVGRAHALAGRSEAARLAWEAGLAVVDARLKTAPQALFPHLMRGELLAWLGRTDEALHEARTVAELARSDHVAWFNSEARIYAVLARADDALPLLEKFRAAPVGEVVGWPLTPALLRIDPLWDKIRDNPRFQALCAEPVVRKPDDGGQKTAAVSEGAQLAARAKVLYTKFAYTREDLATAEELARRATEKEPDSAAAWGARAAVNATYLQRLWDLSDHRLQETQSAASRALGLNADEPEALWALGRLLVRQGATAQAEVNLRRAVTLVPTENRFIRAHAGVLTTLGRVDEQRSELLAAVRRDPRDPLLRYDLAQTYAGYITPADPQGVGQALAHLDAGIAAQPLGSLLLLKASMLAGWRGDLRGMRATLDELEKLPLFERTEDRAIYVAMWGALLEHDAERVTAAAGLTAKTYFDDLIITRHPKDWTLALAHRLAGKENLARLDWQRAEAVVRARLRDDPNNQVLASELATTLVCLGLTGEAAQTLAPIEAAWSEELNPPRARLLAQYYAAVGDAGKAAPYLRRGLDAGVFFTRKTIALDPWWDKIRGAPEFEVLLKEPMGKK